MSRVFLIIFLLLYSALWSAEQKTVKIEISSPAFKHNGAIPVKYTCEGSDISPAVTWKNVPAHAKSLILIADDPDAPHGTWVHWVVFNIHPGINGFKENINSQKDFSTQAQQGMNDFEKKEYGGPCPPEGVHRYFFKIYALDTMLDLPSGATKEQVVAGMKNHIIGKGEIIGTYIKKK